MPTERRRDILAAAGLFCALFVAYNANGREIGSYDSQSTKFAARELLLRGTLSLNHVVGATPAYAERWGFVLAADGRYRSAYSPAAPVMAAALTWPLWKAGVIDVRAPLAPALMAKFTASLLAALTVVLAFFTARDRLARRSALLLAAALGLGTGFWSTVSQTLWQTETAAFGLALAVLAFVSPLEPFSLRRAAMVGLGLGLAGAARAQVAPVVAVILCGTWLRGGWRTGAVATGLVVLFAAALGVENVRWFGHPLGPLPQLQPLNASLHGTSSLFRLGVEGFAGLLVSPSRGLLLFSPIVLVAAAGVRWAVAEDWHSPLRWCALAGVAQFVLYGSYSVWWGGHTFGPRYLLDLLPLGVPLAAAAVAHGLRMRVVRLAVAAALIWSVVVAATGAWCYPHDAWNSDPTDIDRDQARLWSWSDSQIARCWTRGISPQNFSLLTIDAIRVPPP